RDAEAEVGDGGLRHARAAAPEFDADGGGDGGRAGGGTSGGLGGQHDGLERLGGDEGGVVHALLGGRNRDDARRGFCFGESAQRGAGVGGARAELAEEDDEGIAPAIVLGSA